MSYQKSVTDFFGLHKGKPGVIMCSGPSLIDVPKQDLQGFISMAVNSAILHYPDCHYFISDDQDLKNWSYFTRDLVQSRCIKFLYSKKLGLESKRFRPQEVCEFDHTWWFDPISGRKNMDGIIMRKHTTGKIIGARSSTASALHMMYLMGCSPILIAGMDGRVVDGRRYFWEIPGQPMPWRTNGGLQRNSMSLILGKKELLEIGQYWEEFAVVNEDIVPSIWNCCPDSAVESFSKMTWEEAKSKLSGTKQ
jgi:hypothetical protein